MRDRLFRVINEQREQDAATITSAPPLPGRFSGLDGYPVACADRLISNAPPALRTPPSPLAHARRCPRQQSAISNPTLLEEDEAEDAGRRKGVIS